MVKTRAGLTPVENEVPYAITTEQAEEFLQQKIEAVVKMMNNNGANVTDDIKIMMFTSRCSKKFMPMMLLMPTSVLKGKKEKKNQDELDMFNPESSEKLAKMKDPIWNLVKCYIYDNSDEAAFFSNAWRQALGVSLKTSHVLKANRLPKIQKFNKGQNEFVACLIDPVRLFHDMLEDVNNNSAKFNVYIGQVDQIKSGNYKYEVYRTITKNKNKNKSYEDKIAWELNQRLNG